MLCVVIILYEFLSFSSIMLLDIIIEFNSLHMFPKILVAVLAFAGNFSGKLPSKGMYLGFSYDSIFVRAVVTQFEYLWALVIINIIFTMMFSVGFDSFKSFLTLAIIWLSMGPISALVFNTFCAQRKGQLYCTDWLALVMLGSVLVVANKEILAFIKK